MDCGWPMDGYGREPGQGEGWGRKGGCRNAAAVPGVVFFVLGAVFAGEQDGGRQGVCGAVPQVRSVRAIPDRRGRDESAVLRGFVPRLSTLRA